MSNDIVINNEDYVKAVRQLPRPSAAQTAQFASYVSAAHSWYKHLPLYPKVPFNFFLDPNAGKKMIYNQTGKVRFEDETSEKGFHYTHQTTNRYRKRFGYWNYHAAYGTSFRLPLKEGEVSSTESSIGLKILGLQSETLEISPALIETGTAYLSAFVHSHTNIGILRKRNKRRLESLESDFLATLDRAPSLPENLRFLWAVLNTKGWYPLDDDNPIVSNKVYQNVFSKENMLHHRIEIDKEFWDKKTAELGVSLSKVLQAIEIAKTLKSKGSTIEISLELDMQSKWEKKCLSEEDSKNLLQIWKEKLSDLEIEKAMEILLQLLEENVKNTLFKQEEYQSLSQDEKGFMRSLVTESLACEIKNITNEEKQRKKVLDFWNHFWKHNIESFPIFAQKHYSLNPVETNLIQHLVRERIQQLESMKTAMNNFLDAVYES